MSALSFFIGFSTALLVVGLVRHLNASTDRVIEAMVVEALAANDEAAK